MQAVQDLTVENRVSRTQYQFTAGDPDADELHAWTGALLERLKELPELRDVATDQQTRGLQVSLVIDRQTASRLGITPELIDNTLYDAFGQRQVVTLFTQLNQYPSDPGNQARVPEKPGETAGHLRSFAERGSRARSASSLIWNRGSLPSRSTAKDSSPPLPFRSTWPPGASLGNAVTAIDRVQNELGKPAALQAGFQGSAAAFQASLKNEPLLILAALVTVYIVLGVLYESYIHPITILSTLSLRRRRRAAGVAHLPHPLSMIALIGIILLIGIVKKNGILIVDFALTAEREEGKSAMDAIYQASLLRFRPIIMTTLTALLAGLPLALGTGTGAELRRPLGITIIGGLVVSQLLTLYTTPVIYIFFDRFARKAPRSRAEDGGAGTNPQAQR